MVEQGTAYGLDAATGKVLWRRFVALDAKSPAVTVLPVIGPAAGDFVLCDPVNRELLCVRGATGGLVGVWPSNRRSWPGRCRRASGCCC